LAKKKLTNETIEKVLEELGDKNPEETKRIKHRLVMRMSRLGDMAIDVLERAMKNGAHREAIQAANLILRSQGVIEAPEAANDSTLTVVLPSGVQVSSSKPNTLEVKSEIQDDTN